MLNTEKVKILKAERNWTNKDLAEHSGLSTSMISRIMSGDRKGGYKTMAGMKEAFPEVPVKDLIKL